MVMRVEVHMYGQKYDTHTPPGQPSSTPKLQPDTPLPPSRGDLLASDIGLSSRLSKGVRNITYPVQKQNLCRTARLFRELHSPISLFGRHP